MTFKTVCGIVASLLAIAGVSLEGQIRKSTSSAEAAISVLFRQRIPSLTQPESPGPVKPAAASRWAASGPGEIDSSQFTLVSWLTAVREPGATMLFGTSLLGCASILRRVLKKV